ncbi:MAG: FtsX-like permease family protein [Verrucomicrobia bacterium]|nr:FtsX-like permease family protein [Verrucomicrobiota bacterium]MCH8526634.1 FtsX-like permease family protein [Kiritimatiellia bacterium]
MKEIVAKDQVDLGSARCVQLAFAGMVFRLFRSLITVAILGMAVAFLAHMLAYSVMSGESVRRIWLELEADRTLGVQLRRLESPDPAATILTHWQRRDDSRMAEHRAWAGLNEADAAEIQRIADAVRVFERTIHSFSPRQRAILAGDRGTLELLNALADASTREAFLERNRQLERTVPLGSAEALTRLAEEDWPALQKSLARVRAGHLRATGTLEASLSPQTLGETLIATPGRVEELAAAAGFDLQGMDFPRLAAFAGDARLQRRIEETLGSMVIRRALSRSLNVPVADVHNLRLLTWLADSPGHAEEFDALLAEAEAFEPLGAADVHRVAARALHVRRLQRLVPEAPDLDAADSLFGLDTSARWLILLAFLVCVIGVANAMLMSVTERFTEIATMKCLGAMDKFIMLMFVFEAAIQGLLGGIFGAVLGLVLAWIRGASEFGNTLAVAPVLGAVLIAALSALGIGILLAVLAAVGPSLVAARLAPMEAMRVE